MLLISQNGKCSIFGREYFFRGKGRVQLSMARVHICVGLSVLGIERVLSNAFQADTRGSY